MPTILPKFDNSVFINCPFDDEYAPMHEAIIFTIKAMGFEPRSSRELDDGGVRVVKILKIISECRYGIHDISRTELDVLNALPRFNMPFELGLDMGCREFGSPKQKQKCLKILDVEDYRYQKFLSDLGGQDPVGHANDPYRVIAIVRDWLAVANRDKHFPSPTRLHRHYDLFVRELPDLCHRWDLDEYSLSFIDYVKMVDCYVRELIPRARKLYSRPSGNS